MKFQGITGNFTEANVDALAVAVFKGEKAVMLACLKDLDKLTGGLIARRRSRPKSSKAKRARPHCSVLRRRAGVKASRLLLVGVGDENEYKPSASSPLLAGRRHDALRKRNIKSFALLPAIGERVRSKPHSMRFRASSPASSNSINTRPRTRTTRRSPNSLSASKVRRAAISKTGIARGQAIGESIEFTRDLANEPPNILTPTEMASRAQKMAREVGLKCEILDEARMQKMGMGSLLSVSRRIRQPAKLIVLRYTPAKATGKKGDLLALVGKGITFDTGGISLKPARAWMR